MQLDELTTNIESFSLEQPSDVLSEAYKTAIGYQHKYKPTSPEAKLLVKFQHALLKKIKSQRTATKSIEQHDADTLAKLEASS